MSDDRPVMPRGSVSRTARLASLPLGAAGRATLPYGHDLRAAGFAPNARGAWSLARDLARARAFAATKPRSREQGRKP